MEVLLVIVVVVITAGAAAEVVVVVLVVANRCAYLIRAVTLFPATGLSTSVVAGFQSQRWLPSSGLKELKTEMDYHLICVGDPEFNAERGENNT